MLRVYSILYMEKLWIHSPSSDLKQVDHSESSSILSEVQVVPAAAAAAAKDGYGATSRDIIQVDQEDQEQLQVQEVIIPEVEEEPLEVQITEYTLEEIVIDTGALNDIEEEEEEEETSDNNTSSEDDNSDKDSVNQAQQDEKVVNSLAIDTKQIHPQDQTEEEEFSASAAAADHPTSLSSSSSIVPPLTPSSIHSVHNHSDFADQNYQKRPRTTSLIRRETNKFNDRRKSLTKKLKRALTVKTENKRNSV